MKNSAQTRLRLFGLGEQVAQVTPNNTTFTPEGEAHAPQPTTTATPTEKNFGSKEYAEVWQELIKAIGEEKFFAGKITTQHSGFSSTLTATLIIYRTPDPNDNAGHICKIVPVWWELATHTTTTHATTTHATTTHTPCESPNNFSFNELLDCGKQMGERN